MRVLVADDDPVSRLMLQAAVEDLGHECLGASDGDEAWRLFREAVPEVLVTDRVMPGVDGLELCRRVRSEPAITYTYVILVTSLDDRQEILHGMEAGADDYLTKPLDPFALQTRLMAAARVTALHAELAGYQAELDRLASTDALTGLRNRRSLEHDLDTLHARSRRYGGSYCVVMCDVDCFKSYNDNLGHLAGDEALRAVAAALTGRARQGDGVYRYGGEEFVLLLPEQTLESGTVAAEGARQAVEALALPHPWGAPGGVVTISAGVAALVPGQDLAVDDLLAQADANLYRAKAAGRNRVVS